MQDTLAVRRNDYEAASQLLLPTVGCCIPVPELKTAIFAWRAMVDQAREGLCYHRETYRFSMLNIEKIASFDLS